MFRDKSKAEAFFQSKFFAAIILLIAGFLVYKIFLVSYQKYQVKKEIASLKGTLNDKEKQIDDLKKLVENLKDEDYLQKEARKKLNLQLPGEQAVIIIDDKNKSTESVESDKIAANASIWSVIWSNPKKWWRMIVNHET